MVKKKSEENFSCVVAAMDLIDYIGRLP